jgi:hypothetical protein
MRRTAVLVIGVLLATGGAAAAQGLPDGTFASSKEGCAELKQKTAAELGDQRDFTVLNKTGFDAGVQRCDFVTVTAHSATSWLATAFCQEADYSYPDLFAIVQKANGDLRMTRMTVQQPSFDQTEEEELSADDLDPTEIGRTEGVGGDSPAPEEEVPAATDTSDDAFDIYFRCENVKP